MSNEIDGTGSAMRLSDDDARRLLARAIELDHQRGASSLVVELRAVALEAGISSAAFDAAVQEFRSHRFDNMRMQPNRAANPGLFSRIWRRLRGPERASRSFVEAIVSNVISAVLLWITALLCTRILAPLGWRGMDVGMLAGSVLGLGIARRLHARIVEIALMGLIASQLAVTVMHLLFGVTEVQGRATLWAVIVAGVSGALIAVISRKSVSPAQNGLPAAQAHVGGSVTNQSDRETTVNNDAHLLPRIIVPNAPASLFS